MRHVFRPRAGCRRVHRTIPGFLILTLVLAGCIGGTETGTIRAFAESAPQALPDGVRNATLSVASLVVGSADDAHVIHVNATTTIGAPGTTLLAEEDIPAGAYSRVEVRASAAQATLADNRTVALGGREALVAAMPIAVTEDGTTTVILAFAVREVGVDDYRVELVEDASGIRAG